MPRPKKEKELSRADLVILFIETYLFIPEGMNVGQPFKLESFQKKFIRDVYSGNKVRVRKAILSIARKNGKSALIAALLIVHLVGPEAKLNSQICSGARSKEQASVVYKLAEKMINLSPVLKPLVRMLPSVKIMYGLPMNVEYKALSAEGKTAHGGSPVLAILDEVGQVRGSKDDFIDAIITSQGAHDSPLLLVISTQAESDLDLLSIWIDDALANPSDKSVVCHVYAADEKSNVTDIQAWKKANPGLGKFRSLEDIKRQAENAKRMPSFENTFRNLFLNQRISVNSPFISRNTWLQCKSDPYPLETSDYIYAGLDLSAKTDLTAFILLGIKHFDNCIAASAHCYFWTPQQGLVERAKRDRAPYDIWADNGYIKTTPGATVDYEYVATDIQRIIEGLHIEGLAYDRWRIDILKKEFEKIGLDIPMKECGQGFKDMSPAIEALEKLILNAELRHGNHPVLNMCAANAVTVKDAAGNRKLDKSKATGRIDGIVALAMAAALAEKSEATGDLDEFLAKPIML